VDGAEWSAGIDYLTFLPDFTPRAALEGLRPLEAWLERSRLGPWSAHFVARLEKVQPVAAAGSLRDEARPVHS
jgi:hypothetical protein